jgi:hypothetical protein
LSSSIGMKGRKREHRLIKNGISRDVNASHRWFQTFVPLMLITITKKYTPSRLER